MAVEPSTIARPYAKAAFDFALAKQALPAWSLKLSLLAQVCLDPAVSQLLKDPRVTSSQLSQLFFEVGEKVLDEASHNFISLLAEKHRLSVLPEIAAQYEVLRAQQEKTLVVDVASFKPLSDAQKEKLAISLKKRLQRDVQLNCQLDDSMVGGAVIKAGDLVIDGSVRSQLTRLQTELTN